MKSKGEVPLAETHSQLTNTARRLRVELRPTDSKADAVARTALQPTTQAALTLTAYNKGFGELSVNTLVSELSTQCKLASSGDLGRAEALLTAQAHTLDAIFNNLARQAAVNTGKYMAAGEAYLRLALKAQSQCRATLETLATIKYPHPVAFVRQANIGHAVQVNNGASPDRSTHAHARKKQSTQSKLLEQHHGERLDFGASRNTSQVDPPLETLEAIDRSKDAGR